MAPVRTGKPGQRDRMPSVWGVSEESHSLENGLTV